MVRCNVPDESACALIAKPPEEEKCMLRPCAVVDDERYENEIQSNTNSIQSSKRYTWRTEHWSSVSYCVQCTPLVIYIRYDFEDW